jgi:hypothetical protein
MASVREQNCEIHQEYSQTGCKYCDNERFGVRDRAYFTRQLNNLNEQINKLIERLNNERANKGPDKSEDGIPENPKG